MTMQESLAFVDELAILKFFPTQSSARATLAKKLIEWCQGGKVMPSEQARWLVDMALEMDEYPGPQVLHKMLEDKFYPSGAAAVYKPTKYHHTEVLCRLCEGWWTVVDPATGKYVWCTCSGVEETKRLIPNWLDTRNRFPGRTNMSMYRAAMSTKNFMRRI